MGFPIPPEKIEYRHYINGEFVESSDNGKFELKSPYSHEKITDICEASVDDTNRAVAAAKAAFPAWSAKSPAERGALMKALAGKIREAHNELGQLNAMDMGRPVGVIRVTIFVYARLMSTRSPRILMVISPRHFLSNTLSPPMRPRERLVCILLATST